jgi:hypothetical protein
MSYARIGKDSDVYVYGGSEHSVLVCCACRLHPTGLASGYVHESVFPETWGQALDHFLLHIKAGHRVPDRVFKRLVQQAQLETARDAPTAKKKAKGPALPPPTKYVPCHNGPFPEQGKKRRYKRSR